MAEDRIITDGPESKLHLTELIDVNILQQLQDAFSAMTGMAALTTDADGNPVTEGSNFTDFCMHYTRKSELGHSRCEQCDKHGAEITLESGKACTYYCHAGLVDYAAPIMANGVMVGSFIGGQILTSPPELDKFREIAKELDIDPDEYVEAVKKVKIIDKAKVDKAADSLETIANTLSDLAYKSICIYQNNIEIEKASNMKSDFLANMSHEIRTPMNAILGMVDLALREDMSPAARDFIKQIKSSGKNLLVIINDILDFSKIEAGKMEIIEAEFEPLSVINDVASIVNSRIVQKDIELTMDISTHLPKKIYGDSYRIHQILVNLLNNAVKFTKEGEVHLALECIPDENRPDYVFVKASVSDTGIGIKKEDMAKLFNSFQQVDSKRNRNIEGTGLGLAITQQLVGMMGGTITVESEYGIGSTFTVTIPHKVVDENHLIPRFDVPKQAAVLVYSGYIRKQLYKDLSRINVGYIEIEKITDVGETPHDYLFIGERYLTEEVLDYLREHPDTECIGIASYNYRNTVSDLPNIKIIRKPVYSISLYNAMGIVNIDLESEHVEEHSFTFVAPDAKILVVDDNSVNLAVAKGLLEPLQMHIDTAESASKAIQMLHKTQYDLIFMDHMMPEVDGIEATHIIRRLMRNYDNIPIIALTANAVSGAREMFINEGMNDFVAKPIEISEITAKLKYWLPPEKIQITSGDEHDNPGLKEAGLPDEIGNLNIEEALRLLGSESLFKAVLKEYYCSIDKKAQSIEHHLEANEIREYTIEVHALKSSSKQIGADELSALAKELEAAGNEKNMEFIRANTAPMLEQYRQLKKVLAPIFPEVCEHQEGGKPPATREKISELLAELKEALKNFDTLQVDDVIIEMDEFDYPEEHRELFDALKGAAENTDIELCLEIAGEWREILTI
ncbi:MAG: PocR ligand-binding domain-containing protein [Oscillospiraceae bacterium]|nr:PocR ligand-binding domain-containing protein [Oscillospiraceae bacterium]